MKLKVAYRHYRRAFTRPLRTAHGEWALREGFILRVENATGIGYGEVAPIPDFGTETMERAADFLEQWVRDPIIMPSGLPCCAFALSVAGNDVYPEGAGRGSKVVPARLERSVAALLPSGSYALEVAQAKVAAGYKTLKWKIGVHAFEMEGRLFEDLLRLLPNGVALRLDANGGLSQREFEDWLALLEPHRDRVEYLEQALPPGQEARMDDVSRASGIPIALDESLNMPGAERWMLPGAWKGPLVIKPLLMGNVSHWLELLKPIARQLVFSSAFETGIGFAQALELADALPAMHYALGFDTLDAFNDNVAGLPSAPVVTAAARSEIDFEAIWNHLPPLN